MSDHEEGQPVASAIVIRRARVRHVCEECRRTIFPGDPYEYFSGVWEGGPASYKTCARCALLREAHVRADQAQRAEEGESTYRVEVPFGFLFPEIRGACRERAMHSRRLRAELYALGRELSADPANRRAQLVTVVTKNVTPEENKDA